MCSISGIVRTDGDRVNPADLTRMAQTMRHRGPDGAGWASLDHGRVGLAHTRLSIIDLAGGHQPLYNEDHSVCVVFNGEIYGYRGHRARLQASGHQLLTTSDTEVLVHLWEDWGPDMVRHIDGEFAFLLSDQRQGCFFAARDRSGIKPLYLHRGRGEMIFASEAKAILSLDRIPKELDQGYLAHLTRGLYPSGRSPFRGIELLEPGHTLLVDRKGVRPPHRYWTLDYSVRTTDAIEASEGLQQELKVAVRDRLVADVPVGVYLSSGVDSATVAAHMAEEGGTFRAYHLSYGDESPLDESTPARALARHFGMEFHLVETDARDLAEALEDTLYHTELPLWNLHSVAKARLSEFARRAGARVCLAGEGADESFGGYPYFLLEALEGERHRGLDPEVYRKRLEAFVAQHASSEGILWGRWKDWVLHPQTGQPSYHLTRARENQRLDSLFLGRPDEPSFRPGEVSLDAVSAFNATRRFAREVLHHYVLPTLGDRVELGHAVECRTPFLDHRVLEFAAGLPPELLMDTATLQDKLVVRAAARRRVPSFILDAPKRPFLSPGWPELYATEQGKALFEQSLSLRALEDHGIFDPTRVSTLFGFWKQAQQPTPQLDLVMGLVLTTHLMEDQILRRPDRPLDSFVLADRSSHRP